LVDLARVGPHGRGVGVERGAQLDRRRQGDEIGRPPGGLRDPPQGLVGGMPGLSGACASTNRTMRSRTSRSLASKPPGWSGRLALVTRSSLRVETTT
jgi:hypothetical protein